MNFSSPNFFILLQFLLLVSLVYHVFSFDTSFHQISNQTFQQKEKIANRLQQINKPSVKTIHSPDGDIIDCVLFQNQPAFDHPLLKGHKPSDPPERPKGYNKINILNDNFQLWSSSGESCPEGTIPIIRTTEQDILRAGSLDRFGKKSIDQVNSLAHEYVNAQFRDGGYYGGQASFNVWAPHVEYAYEFSLSQMWVVAGAGEDLSTLEVGWHVYPQLNGDNHTRLFIYWTADAYKNTGCHNLQCPGFVQTNSKIVVGGAISTTSMYNGSQFEISLMIWKDQKTDHWWLEVGPGNLIGYWPSSLFPNFKDHADRVDFGGEIINSNSKGTHTSTQMGSGHFAEEGFGKAAFIRNMELVDHNNNLNMAQNPQFLEQFPNCYDQKIGSSKEWGSYFYFGGPGRNIKCQ
ncbi:protein neprosin-like [Cicer arietinum]|uniref:Uncharacterized protein LOC101508414 n=1 Tax=Cicer arietinum TaxID=3827 RepID=A0A3Q7Y3Z0_CICAR|nr:uncharacterized protein LOC101508414 [Cicer arietinum]